MSTSAKPRRMLCLVDDLIPPAPASTDQPVSAEALRRLSNNELVALCYVRHQLDGVAIDDPQVTKMGERINGATAPEPMAPAGFRSTLDAIRNRFLQYRTISDADLAKIDDLISRSVEDRNGALLEAREENERLKWQAEADKAEIESLKAKLADAMKPQNEQEAEALALLAKVEAFLNDKDATEWEE